MSVNRQAAIASHWLPETWARSVEEVLRSFDASGAAAALQASADRPDRETWLSWSEPLWYEQSCDAIAGGALRIGAPRQTLDAVWKCVSGEELEPGADRTTALETYRELLNQAAASVAVQLGGEIGRQAQVSAAVESEPLAEELPAVEIRLEDADGNVLTFALGLSDELAGLLFDPESPDAAAGSLPSAGRNASEQAVVHQPPPEDSLRLLNKVELDLAVSFGNTTMTLEQAMKLSSGSIVELNRLVSEPVELLVNECVIARGEVVVVDGNYGVRITEIARPSDRVQDLL